MSHYHHLSISERECIWENKISGKTLGEIAALVGRSKSTVSRELSRNSTAGSYRPSQAQSQYHRRRRLCHRKRLLEDTPLKDRVVRLLTEQQWSPEQISNRLAQESRETVSYATIYRAVQTGIMEPKGTYKNSQGRYPMSKHLRRKGWRGKKKKKKNNRTTQHFVHQTIEDRPQEANDRSQLGHLEGDLVYSSYHKRYIITLVDRRADFIITGMCKTRQPEEVAEEMYRILKPLPWVRTVTLDRGTEFAYHGRITQRLPHIQFYFAHPYAPWERGLNENTNGLLRQYVPKHTYKVPLSPELLQEFTNKLNHRPRKTLGWKTPFEVLFNQSLHLT